MAGQVNYRGSLPRSTSNVLEPMLQSGLTWQDCRNLQPSSPVTGLMNKDLHNKLNKINFSHCINGCFNRKENSDDIAIVHMYLYDLLLSQPVALIFYLYRKYYSMPDKILKF